MAWAPKGHQALLSQCANARGSDLSAFRDSWASGATRGTPSAIERHQIRLDLACSEIDGLIAGLHFQDQVEKGSDNIPAYPAQISEDDFAPQASFANAQKSETDMRDQPNSPQWKALRTLRQESEFHHARFRNLAGELNNPIISRLLDQYPDAQRIRNTGALLFKDVLEGFRPDKLSHVFVFTCFVYAISQVLHKKGRIDQIDILADIRAWRALIRDKGEMQAFDSLAPLLWPESKEHCHYIDVSLPHKLGAFATSNRGTERGSHPWPPDIPTESQVPSSRPNEQMTATQLLPAEPGHSAMTGANYASSLGITGPLDVESLLLLGSVDLMNSTHEAVGFADTSWMTPGPFCPPLLNVPQLPDNLDTLDPGEKKFRFSPHERPEEAKLVETVMFLMVFAFLQDIGDQFLHILSGRTLSSGRHKLFSTQKGDQEIFYKEARESFSQLCTQHPNSRSSAFRALISVAEMLTSRGHLRSFAEIKHYLVALATAALAPGPNFESFIYAIVAEFPVPDGSRKRGRSEDDDPSSPEQARSKTAKRRRLCKVHGCDKSYSDASGLRKHVDRVHS